MHRILTGAALASALALPAMADEVVFKCYFDWVCDPNTKCQDAGLDARFKVDLETNEVSRIGGNALSQFSLILGDRAITILETPVSGGTATTTVKISDGAAVHSENLITGNTLTPMQYLGECLTF